MKPHCPECHLPAVDVTNDDTGARDIHQQTAVCKRGHIWITKWFAERST